MLPEQGTLSHPACRLHDFSNVASTALCVEAHFRAQQTSCEPQSFGSCSGRVTQLLSVGSPINATHNLCIQALLGLDESSPNYEI